MPKPGPLDFEIGSSYPMKQRIAVIGLFHETHSFLPDKTRLEDFEITLGRKILESRGSGSPMDGFLAAAEKFNWEVVPIADYRALPGGVVEDRVWTSFMDDVENHWPDTSVDAIFLVLHGAMLTETIEDLEGELLQYLRQKPGLEALPIFGILDLHANFTPNMARFSNCLVAYRENPHTDAYATAVKAAEFLNRSLSEGKIPATYCTHSGILLSPSATSTAQQPMSALIEAGNRLMLSNPDLWSVNILGGFSYADCTEAGLSFSVITTGPEEQARDILLKLRNLAWDLREHAKCFLSDPDSVLSQITPESEGPIVLVEPSDNIGGGAPGDGTGILRALLAHPVRSALVVLQDPLTVKQLEAAQPGETVQVVVGGRGFPGDSGPVSLEAILLSRGSGKFKLEDPNSHLASMSGTTYNMGPCAVIRDRWITILLTSHRTPPFDLGQLRSQGIEPTEFQVIGVKAAVAHRRAYDPISKNSFTVETPGPCASRLDSLPYRRLRRPIFPLDAETEVLNFFSSKKTCKSI